MKGNSYTYPPDKLRNSIKTLINIENKDNKYFRCSSISQLSSMNKDATGIKKPDFKPWLKIHCPKKVINVTVE